MKTRTSPQWPPFSPSRRANRLTKQEFGAVSGAVIGGVVGSTIGGGTGRTVAIVAAPLPAP
jgi:outer membrane lipoprotein SlyB